MKESANDEDFEDFRRSAQRGARLSDMQDSRPYEIAWSSEYQSTELVLHRAKYHRKVHRLDPSIG